MATNASLKAPPKRPLSPDEVDQAVEKHIKINGSFNGIPIGSKPFRFLDLPGELRNRVYEIVVGHANCDNYPVIAARSSTNNQPPYGVNACLALTQVCRLIRREFQPIARTHTTTYIRPQTARDYIKMLVDTDVTSPASSALKANVIVATVGPTGGKCIIDNAQSMVIDLCNDYPSTNIKFALPIYENDRRPEKKRDINAVLHDMFTRKLDLWNMYFSPPLNNIVLTVYKYREVKLTLNCHREWPSILWAGMQLSHLVETLGLNEIRDVGVRVELVGKVEQDMYTVKWEI